MVDPGRLRAMLDRLETEVRHLRRMAKEPAEELLDDTDRLASIKYRFVVAIETCIDVGEHIISSGFGPPPALPTCFWSSEKTTSFTKKWWSDFRRWQSSVTFWFMDTCK